MTEQLPVINTSHNVTATKGESSSLLGRGLAAIQRKETSVVLADLDSRYRQARDIYNRITDYGEAYRFEVELLPTQEELLNEPLLKQLQPFYNLMKQLKDVFAVFQELANQGYGKAYFPLSRMSQGGQGISNNEKCYYDGSLAYEWCFANQTLNDPEIWIDLGCLHYYDGENEEAIFWYSKAAEQGSAKAQNKLGQIFEIGDSEDVIDYHEAFFWYQKAAHQNYATGQMNYGLMWLGVEDFEQDFDEAIFWFHKAAEQGYANAQYNLGKLYEDCDQGLGFFQDDEMAVSHYQDAAKQGYAPAQFSLACMYLNGSGIKQNDKQAIFWYIQAANQNNKGAKSFLKNLGINWQES
ncbi:hypothetical protein BCS42_03840 [Crenothrix sp. D3]|nr:hypothetical protein BCS42_03840 [Crenothrix sp. D3]